MDDLHKRLAFGLALAEGAAREILPRFHNSAVTYKSDGTEVTDADRAAELAMRQMINEHFPHDAVLGEEFGYSHPPYSHRTWVLDPIDGTAWFTLGVPIFGTLIALCEDVEPLLGVIHFPALGETVYAAKGIGCWFKGADGGIQQIHVVEHCSLSDATVCASGPHGSDIQLHPNTIPYNLTRIIKEARKFKFGGDCIQHALVCRGKINAAIDTVMKPWDIAAIIPCVQEAGGVVTDLAGNRSSLLHGGNLLSSCSPILHEEVLEAMAADVSQWISVPL